MRDPVGEQLVGWGRVARIRTRGRVTGNDAEVAVGFVETPRGIRVAAGGFDAAWARNLLADPRCDVTIAHDTYPAEAEELHGAEHAATVRQLILRYGTPAEKLGAGPAFELVRREEGDERWEHEGP